MDRRLQILHLEDDPLDAQLILATLEDSGIPCDVVCVDTRERFEAALAQGGWDLVLSDYTLPLYDGRTALAKALELCPDVPFILVSGTVGEEAAIVGLLAGATDYVLKDRLPRLVPAVQRAMREAENGRSRREAERAVKASEQRYRRLFEASNDGILVLDAASGAVVDANPSLLSLLGYPRETLVGKTVAELGLAAQDPAAEKAFSEVRRMGSAKYPDLRLMTRSGALVNVELVATAYAEGDLKLVQCSVRDISVRRQLEEELRQAQKMDAFGQVAGGVAHDFNNLLTVIQGNVSILQDLTPSDAPAREYLEELGSAADRGAALTSQLLLFSRRRAMQRATLDLTSVVASFGKMLQRVLGENILLELRGDPGAMAHADQGMMEQVLMNLAINARDAMGAGGKLVIATSVVQIEREAVGESPRRRAGRFVRLSVSDDGCGIAPENLPRIFEPFFTTKAVGKGTGLGLATIYGIVEHHDGWIEVESQVGVGTTFHVFLPCVAAYGQPQPSSESRLASTEAPATTPCASASSGPG